MKAHCALLLAALLVVAVQAQPTMVNNTDQSQLYVKVAAGAPFDVTAVVRTAANANGVGNQALPVVVTQSFSKEYTGDVALQTAKGGVPVLVQIVFVAVKKINGVEQEFTADFYLVAYWPDKSVCPPPAVLSSCQFDPNNMWTPTMEFTNAIGGVTGNVANPYSVQTAPTNLLPNVANSRNLTAEGWGDVWVKYDQRLTGAFSTSLNLVDFPFDKQKVTLKLESSLYDATQVEFMYINGASKKALPAGFDILEWSNDPDPVNIVTTKQFYPLFNQYFSRYTVTIDVYRDPGFYINKVVIGCCLLATMNFFVFSLAVNEPDRQMGTISIFLAMVAYLFVTSSDLPKVATSTRIDKFMTWNFVFIFACMAIHAALYTIRENDDAVTAAKAHETRVQKRARRAAKAAVMGDEAAAAAANSVASAVELQTTGGEWVSDALNVGATTGQPSSVFASGQSLRAPRKTSSQDDNADGDDSDDDVEVEAQLSHRVLAWRHILCTRRFDIGWVAVTYLSYVIGVLIILYGPSSLVNGA